MASTIQTPSYTPAPGSVEDKEGTPGANGAQAPVVLPDGTTVGGNTHTAGARKADKKDPFATDSAARQTGPNALAGQVGNKEPYDEHYPDLKKAFEANGVPVPTEQQVRTTAAAAQNSPDVKNLVDGVKANIKTGSPLPTVASYAAAQSALPDTTASDRREAQAAFNQNTLEKIGEAKKSDSTAAAMKNGSVSSLIMFVMLQAKKELQLDKQSDLDKMKQYTTISDLMNQHLTYLTGKQQDLQSATVAAKKDKDKVTVEMDNPQSFDIDNLGKNDDGSAKLIPDYGKDKNGKANPETSKVTQVQMTSIMQNFQNQLQQVQSRIQREQTSYQGHDSQDSTLSNIITATNKTFADSASAIIRNVQ